MLHIANYHQEHSISKNKLIKKVQSLFCEYLCLSEDVYNGEIYLHDQKRIPISTLISFM